MADVIPTWPSTLPCRPLNDGLSFEPEENVVRSPASIGIGQARRRQTATGANVSMTFRMRRAQFNAFRWFYEDDDEGIAEGAKAFRMLDPFLNEERLWMFTAPYSVAPAGGGVFMVSFTLYRLPE